MTTMQIRIRDKNLFIAPANDSAPIDHIPPAVYVLKEHPKEDIVALIYDRPKFEVPTMTYGRHAHMREEILTAWKNCPSSTGVILRGLLRAGKTMLAEDLGNRLLQQDIPVIMTTEDVSMRALEVAVCTTGPCMLLFDEFGKRFSKEKRRGMITYFSDSSVPKVLLVVTANKMKELDKYMMNRPGRFLFDIVFDRLNPVATSEMVDEYELSDEIKRMINAHVNSSAITFDVLRFQARQEKEDTGVEE